MERLFEQVGLNESEEPSEKSIPKEESEDKLDIPEYDYHKRLWF